MLIYGIIFIVTAAIGLGIFSLFLTNYEKSRPATVVKDYLSTLNDKSLDVLMRESADELNFDLMPREECYAKLRETVRGAKSVLLPTESTEDSLMYALKADGAILGKLILVPNGERLFGFNKYIVTPVEFNASGLIGEQEITVPGNYNVMCNGTVLGEDNIIDKTGHYALLEEFYDDKFISVPGMYTYSTGKYLEEPEIVILDENGNTVDEADEEKACDNCTAEQKEAVRAAAGEFVQAYVNYSSNSYNIYGNYEYLATLMVSGSPLQIRMQSAMSGLGWGLNTGDTLEKIDYHHFMNLGDGRYLCDLTYTNTSLGFAGMVQTVNNLKLIFTESDGRLLAAAMSSY